LKNENEWDADERRFTGFIKLFKKQKRTGGKGVNLRISESICVLFKSWTRMNADLKDLLNCLKNKKGVGMSFNLRISESICVLLKLRRRDV